MMSGHEQSLDRNAVVGWIGQWRPDEIERITQLSQGPLSKSWLVVLAGEKYVLKQRDPAVPVPGIDLAREALILSEVAPAGLGPQAHHVDPAQGLLITGYLEGEVLGETEINSPEVLKRLCDSLRKLHHLSLPAPRLSMDEVVTGYLATLEASTLFQEFKDPVSFAALREVMADWAAGSDAAGICHNDLLHSNIVAGVAIKFIDWEYANVGDPMFDLAGLAHYHGFTESDTRRLLTCYYGDVDARSLQRMAKSKLVVDLVFTSWLMACRALFDPEILPAYGDTPKLLARLRVLPGQYAQVS